MITRNDTGIAADPAYQSLVRRRSRFAWRMALLPLALLLGFLFLMTVFPAVLARPIIGVFTVGMVYGLVILVGSLSATWFFLYRCEREFMVEQARILERSGPAPPEGS